MNKDQLSRKLLETFKIEATEHSRAIVDGLMELEKNPSSDQCISLIEMLHREAHSLKGAARTVNLLDIELICHAVESIFSGWKKGILKSTPQQFDLLHQTLTMLLHLFNKMQNEISETEKKNIADLVTRLNKLIQQDNHNPAEKQNENINFKSTNISFDTPMQSPTIRITSSKLDSLLLKAEELLAVKLITKKYHNELIQIIEPFRSWKAEWNKMRIDTPNESIGEFLTIGLERIKSLENLLLSLSYQFSSDGKDLHNLIDGLLDEAKEMVLLPFSTLLDSFPAMVRNISREQGKEINLVLEGVDIKIDKRILDELKDPLIHLVRNCIDHGIEKPGKRTNKPATGMIKISISQSSGNEIEILISDDGYGIDVNAVRISAIKQGYLTQADAELMNEEEALALVYHSGVSTSPNITKVSGHGIGMAIVHEKMEKIGGYIELKSQYNVGTQIKLTLPLSLTTLNGILVTSAEHTFLLPTTHLERVIRIHHDDIKTIENRKTILVDSKTISFVNLQDILCLPYQADEVNNKKFLLVAVIGIGDNQAAIQVDDIQGQKEVLVKKFNKPLVRIKCIAAATILESGLPVPILSASDLMKAVLRDPIPLKTNLERTDKIDIINRTILVTEDSITTRILLKNILEMAGYEVITAVDGADAWRILRERDIGLVVSDIEMPRMNGFELTKKIRNDDKLKQTPVVLVTMRESTEDRESGIDSGANAYIVKSSFDDGNLISIIKRLI